MNPPRDGADDSREKEPKGPRTPYPVERPGIGDQPGRDPDYIPGKNPESLPKL